MKDITRSRCVYERAILVDYRSSFIWICYAEMELRSRHFSSAREILERAVALLPRVERI